MTQRKFSDEVTSYLYNRNETTIDLAKMLSVSRSCAYLKLENNNFSKCERLYLSYLFNSGRKISNRMFTPDEVKSLKKQAKTRKIRLADIADEMQLSGNSISNKLRSGIFKVSEIYYLKCVLKFEI